MQASKNPVEIKALEEIDSLPAVDVPSLADLNKLEYTTMFFKEAMRVHPPVSLVARKSEKQVEINGNIIPKNVVFMLDFEAQHKNGNIFKNPEKFDPSRVGSLEFGQHFSPGGLTVISRFNLIKFIIAQT
jgi:cytochrome P450